MAMILMNRIGNGLNLKGLTDQQGSNGHQAYSPGQRPGYRDNPVNNAQQGQKQLTPNNAFALTGRKISASSFTQGVALGWWMLPLRGINASYVNATNNLKGEC